MKAVRPFVIVIWVLIPTVMVGGFFLLNLITREILSPFQEQFFRAGHAHAGVLLILSLAFCYFIGMTSLPDRTKVVGCVVLLVGVLAQSGGFFVHMLVGQPGQASIGNYITIGGAGLLLVAIVVLVYALVRYWRPAV